MKIGIPRALLYYKYARLWEGFLGAMDAECVLSPDTNREIVELGQSFAVDEACLSSKIYLGHVAWLMNRCDAVFVPRIGRIGKAGTVCTKFMAVYDLVANTFRNEGLRLLHYNIDLDDQQKEPGAFIRLGIQLGKSRPQSLFAYWNAKQSEKAAQIIAADAQSRQLEKPGVKDPADRAPVQRVRPLHGRVRASHAEGYGRGAGAGLRVRKPCGNRGLVCAQRYGALGIFARAAGRGRAAAGPCGRHHIAQRVPLRAGFNGQ